MTYLDLFNIVDTLGYANSAVVWNSPNPVPDIYIRYYLVDDNPFTNYNEKEIELSQGRYTFDVYDRSGASFETIFEEIKTLIEYKHGFRCFFDLSDGFETDTKHYCRSGDIYYYNNLGGI